MAGLGEEDPVRKDLRSLLLVTETFFSNLRRFRPGAPLSFLAETDFKFALSAMLASLKSERNNVC